ncbi:MAG: tail fiber domain-containing protein, partial [Verrucomicrobiota bacterium]|nr:tail fiber domain-containing protein [Verrucomicrobiota bacterium]
ASGWSATVGGGWYNTASNSYATVGGGEYNTASGYRATVGGGWDNTASNSYATVGGGWGNTASGFDATVGGGEQNTASGEYATVPGGRLNTATNYAFAAGRRAKANHTGAFVWADSTDADIASTNANSMTFRVSGGVRIFSNSGATAGVFLAPGAGSWTGISDRNAKDDFQPVNPTEVLEKVANLPVTTWRYKTQDPSIRHIGPTAQDFKAAFGVGESDTGIATVDADGVALAAIQGLNRKLEARSQEAEGRIRQLEAALKQRDAENAALRARLERIEALLASPAGPADGPTP